MNTFHMEIVTPTEVKFAGQLRQVVVSGVMGQMGILAQHAPLLAMLQPGLMAYTDADGKVNRLAAGSGFVQVAENRAVCLVDFAERPEEVDLDRAKKNLDEVQKKLQDLAVTSADREALRDELKAALARLDIAGHK
ncbi:ATP synthase F1 subunit epsilon [bacterium CPR1]|nr:ATP synthase F1 subunit epsilon [bacterium CPR1]